MTLDELKSGERAIIRRMEVDSATKRRLHSLGVFAGGCLEVREVSLTRATLVVHMPHGRVILRANEAKSIEVDKV